MIIDFASANMDIHVGEMYWYMVIGEKPLYCTAENWGQGFQFGNLANFSKVGKFKIVNLNLMHVRL